MVLNWQQTKDFNASSVHYVLYSFTFALTGPQLVMACMIFTKNNKTIGAN
ncbi:MAG: hypothetical protein IPL21_18030 [Saprospirales bacterium]|nr:hypothetical protein [Saprospirales bacterium]